MWKETVASRAEAWIDPGVDLPAGGEARVASRAEAWIDPFTSGADCGALPRRLPCGGVD